MCDFKNIFFFETQSSKWIFRLFWNIFAHLLRNNTGNSVDVIVFALKTCLIKTFSAGNKSFSRAFGKTSLDTSVRNIIFAKNQFIKDEIRRKSQICVNSRNTEVWKIFHHGQNLHLQDAFQGKARTGWHTQFWRCLAWAWRLSYGVHYSTIGQICNASPYPWKVPFRCHVTMLGPTESYSFTTVEIAEVCIVHDCHHSKVFITLPEPFRYLVSVFVFCLSFTPFWDA